VITNSAAQQAALGRCKSVATAVGSPQCLFLIDFLIGNSCRIDVSCGMMILAFEQPVRRGNV
jgi:hypothetical protein